MTPGSYTGDETAAVDPAGHTFNVPDNPQFWEREDQTRVFCDRCGKGVWADIWDGPVVAV